MNVKDELFGFDLLIAWWYREEWGWHFKLSNSI